MGELSKRQFKLSLKNLERSFQSVTEVTRDITVVLCFEASIATGHERNNIYCLY